MNEAIRISLDLYKAVKTGTNLPVQLSRLRDLDSLHELDNDQKKTAFWINLYNSQTQILLKQYPKMLFENKAEFFRKQKLNVAKMQLSLDYIEHRILRRSKIKWGLGFINSPFVGVQEKVLRVDKLDPKIHFALNCGARSCPPIVAYTPELVAHQLNEAVENYLSTEVKEVEGSHYISKLFLWYLGDFGGFKGVRKFLKAEGLEGVKKIKFSTYDWTIQAKNYKDV